jgi:spermidine/putrescine-binding protein
MIRIGNRVFQRSQATAVVDEKPGYEKFLKEVKKMKLDQLFNHKMNRRNFIRTTAGAGAGLVASSVLPSISPMARAVGAQDQPTFAEGGFNWLTWSDHYFPEQLTEAASLYGIKGNPSLFSDNSEAFLKVQQVGGTQIDLVSGDALWVPKFYEEGLIEPFDLWSLKSARGLFDMALFDLPFFQTADGMNLAFPFGWSPVIIAYNPKYVTDEPTSWEVLWDPKYKGKVAMELQPFDVMAMMGKSLGYDNAYNMTLEQIAAAKQQLIDLLPNVSLLADESIWLATVNLGIEDRVKDAGGPEIKTFVPKEGVVGWMDGEMIVKDAANKDVALNWLDKMETGEWVAKNFLDYGRPLVNRDAYHWLVKNGYEARAKQYLFDKPETVLSMTLKGPSADMESTIAAFNDALATAG